MLKEINELIKSAPAGQDIADACDEIKVMLLRKNISYGNSFEMPINIFSKLTSEEQILIRIDDKLNRIRNFQTFAGDNDLDDLIGYLTLLKVLRNKNI